MGVLQTMVRICYSVGLLSAPFHKASECKTNTTKNSLCIVSHTCDLNPLD